MQPMVGILEVMAEDQRIGPAHVCLYLAIYGWSERLGTKGPFNIRRETLMRLAKLKSKTTYYQIIGDLARWGYIDYQPRKDRRGRNRVRVMEIVVGERTTMEGPKYNVG